MSEREIITKTVACNSCRAAYELSPTNCVSPGRFNYCPNCGEGIDTGVVEMGMDEFMERSGIPYDSSNDTK